MGILIKGGTVTDPAAGLNGKTDVRIKDGLIVQVGEDLKPEGDDAVLDASGLCVLPGLVDMHVHLRDPGLTDKEDLCSGSRAAARGGVTTLLAMPNTKPVIDTPDRAAYVLNKAREVSPVHILQAGSLTRGEEGRELSDIAGMARAGVKALSEDGKSVMDAGLCRQAFAQAAACGLLVCDHCEDLSIRGNGCMNEDENARRLGLDGIPASVEDTITARDMILAAETGARLHLCHVSTEGVTRLLRFARENGWEQVSAEVCPHHLLLSSDDIPGDDPDYKMNPPLRTPRDVQALREALAAGLIDVISTDHAPHTQRDKEGSMRTAAFGIVGLETSLPLIYTHLVRTGILTLSQMVEKMSLNPARLLGLPCGTLLPGHPADVILVDLETPYRIDRSSFVSKGRNTPFDGWEVRGKVMVTIVDGKIVYKDKE